MKIIKIYKQKKYKQLLIRLRELELKFDKLIYAIK